MMTHIYVKRRRKTSVEGKEESTMLGERPLSQGKAKKPSPPGNLAHVLFQEGKKVLLLGDKETGSFFGAEKYLLAF